MDFGTGIIPEELQPSYLSEPNLFLPEKEEGPALLDIINLANSSSRSYGYQAPPSLDSVEQGLQNFRKEGPSATAQAAPLFFDKDKAQLDRYTSNTRDFAQLGYNPLIGQENE